MVYIGFGIRDPNHQTGQEKHWVTCLGSPTPSRKFLPAAHLSKLELPTTANVCRGEPWEPSPAGWSLVLWSSWIRRIPASGQGFELHLNYLAASWLLLVMPLSPFPLSDPPWLDPSAVHSQFPIRVAREGLTGITKSPHLDSRLKNLRRNRLLLLRVVGDHPVLSVA